VRSRDFKLVRDDPRESLELLDDAGIQLSRPRVLDAERAHRFPLNDDSKARVEADAPADHLGIVAVAIVQRRVDHDVRLFAQDRARAECGGSRPRAGARPDERFPPFPVGVDQAEGGDRRLADLCSQLDEPVKGWFSLRIKDPQRAKLLQPHGLA